MANTSTTKKNEAGRPPGARSPNAHEQIRRKLRPIYSAVISNALSGDAAAARLCFDILRKPEDYPLPASSEE